MHMVVKILVTTMSVSISAGLTSGELPLKPGNIWALCISAAVHLSFLHHHCVQPRLKLASRERPSIVTFPLVNYVLACSVWLSIKLAISATHTYVHFRRRTTTALRRVCPLREGKTSNPPRKTAKLRNQGAEFRIHLQTVLRRGARGGRRAGGRASPVGLPPSRPRSSHPRAHPGLTEAAAPAEHP